MINTRRIRAGIGIGLAFLLVAALVVVTKTEQLGRIHLTAYFDNTNAMFPGDEVRILGVPVGKIDTIEPQADRAKVSFWVDDRYQIPAEANAVILSPSLVTARAIQLTPVYTSGPVMADNTVIPLERTAVPVEWDEFRVQLERLTDTLQPTEAGGVSTLGAFVETAADNLRGQGADIRETVIKLSQAFSALGDHSTDLFSTVKHLSMLVSALQDSTGLMKQLNQSLATVTGLLTNDPNEVGAAVSAINNVVGNVQAFVAENKESLGTTSEKLASVTTALVESIDDLEQTLHLAPNAFQNFVNIYQPAQGALTGALAINNFANPISFLCGAIQAASRLGAEQSAKLCVQYLAPIVKNRQYNFLPIGANPFVGATVRPNEVTYSEPWLRPDYVPPAPAPAPAASPPPPAPVEPLAAEGLGPEPVATNPVDGLPGMMLPAGGGS